MKEQEEKRTWVRHGQFWMKDISLINEWYYASARNPKWRAGRDVAWEFVGTGRTRAVAIRRLKRLMSL